MAPRDQETAPRKTLDTIRALTEAVRTANESIAKTSAALGMETALRTRDLFEARDLAFPVLVFGELFRAFAARSETRVFWEVGAFTNVRLLAVVLFSVLVQLGIHHIPAAQAAFVISPLSAADCALTLLAALGPVTVIEVGKLAVVGRPPGDQRGAANAAPVATSWGRIGSRRSPTAASARQAE